jgi:hypothetical protein
VNVPDTAKRSKVQQDETFLFVTGMAYQRIGHVGNKGYADICLNKVDSQREFA